MGERRGALARLGAVMTVAGTTTVTEMAVERKPGRKGLVLGIAISVACIGYLLHKIDFVQARDALAGFGWGYLVLAAASLAAGYAMRIVRWAAMLRAAGAQVTAWACAGPFLGSIALNNTLPMRAGDVVRALVFPAAVGVGRTTATVSLVFERLLDLLTLLLLLAVGIAFSANAAVPEWIAQGALGLAAALLVTCAAIVVLSGRLGKWFAQQAGRPAARRTPLLSRSSYLVSQGLKNLHAMSRSGSFATVALLSILAWLAEAGLFWAVLAGFGLPGTPFTAILVMTIATLSTLVPSSPGYVGPFHVAAFAAVAMLGGTAAQAASFALISHLAVWLPTTVAGALAIALNPDLFRAARKAPESEAAGPREDRIA